MTMPELPHDYNDFVALSAVLGQNPLYAQGAGGNTSLKDHGHMWIKASGTALKEASVRNIFTAVDISQKYDPSAEPVYPRLDNEGELRPSIETSLHAVLPQRLIVHLHAVPVIAVAIQHGAENILKDKLDGLRYAFVPYTKPGWPLALAVRSALMGLTPDIFVLGNHGLILGGDYPAEVISMLAEIERDLEMRPRVPPPPDLEFLQHACASGSWRLPYNKLVHSLATDIVSREYARGGSLYPDHVVFLGRGCRVVKDSDLHSIDPMQHLMVLIEGRGVLFSSAVHAAGEAMAECLAAVLARVPPGARLNYLSARDEDELLNWDAEKYRQTVK